MTLLLFLTGLTTVASTGTSSGVTVGQFTVSGPTVQDIFPVTSVTYSYAPLTKRTV